MPANSAFCLKAHLPRHRLHSAAARLVFSSCSCAAAGLALRMIKWLCGWPLPAGCVPGAGWGAGGTRDNGRLCVEEGGAKQGQSGRISSGGWRRRPRNRVLLKPRKPYHSCNPRTWSAPGTNGPSDFHPEPGPEFSPTSGASQARHRTKHLRTDSESAQHILKVK